MSSVSYTFLDDNYIDLLWFISIEWNLVGTWNLVAHPSTSTAQEPPTQLATEPAETVLMPAVGVPEALPEALEVEAIEAVEALEAVAEGGRNLGKRIWRNRWGITRPVWSFEKARKNKKCKIQWKQDAKICKVLGKTPATGSPTGNFKALVLPDLWDQMVNQAELHCDIWQTMSTGAPGAPGAPEGIEAHANEVNEAPERPLEVEPEARFQAAEKEFL